MLNFIVEEMSCVHCVAAVTRAVKAVDPQAVVDVDLPARAVAVATAADAQALILALAEAGYPARLQPPR